MRWCVMLGLTGCGGATACVSGFELRDDELCYEVVVEDTDVPEMPTAYEAWVGALPECTPTTGDGMLDLLGCLGDACVGDNFAAFTAVLGDVECAASNGTAYCTWPSGVQIAFQAGADGQPSERARSGSIVVYPPFAMTTTDGIGLGSSISCYVDALGDPEVVTMPSDSADGDTQVQWENPSLMLLDGSKDEERDGLVDALLLAGGNG